MFRDLKEYQEIQRIYESKVCISDDDREILKYIEEQEFTQEELDYLVENADEASAQIVKELLEELQPLTEETINQEDLQEVVGKLIKAASKTGLGKKIAASGGAKIGKGLKAIGKSKALQNVTGGVKDLGKAALRKGKEVAKSALKFGGDAAKAVLPGAALAGGVVAGGVGIKKLMNRGKNKTDAKTDTKTDTKTDKGTSFGDAIKANTPEPKSTVIQNTIKNTDNKGGDKKTTTPSGGGGDKKTTPSGGGEKKMSQIEKDNRQRFGNKRVDFLKQKQKDFRARQKGEMSKDDFNKKYPKSQSAKDAYARKNPNSSQAMQNMSYEPEGTPIQETSGYDPIKNYHLANDLAKVYQKIYEPVEEKVDSTDAENYNALVEFIIKENIVSTVEEADVIIAELDNELVESYLTEGVITEGLMDAVNRVKQGVGNVAKKVGTAASGAMNKAKEVAGNVRDKVKTAVQTKVQQGRDLKSGGVDKLKQGNELRQKTQAQTADVAKKTEMARRGDTSAESGGANDPGAARAKLQFLKNKRAKMNQNNSGGKPNQNTSGGNNLGKKQRPVSSPMDMRNEAVEKDAYTTVLEYLLTQNHAATIEEANYIMTELDAETIQGIISES